MTVLITGGAGFIGRRLAETLLRRGHLGGSTGASRIDRIALLDVVPSDVTDPRIQTITGDMTDPAVISRAITRDTTSVFHLAAIVSGMAEADFDLGMRINFDASRLLLETCRQLGHRPRVVFASSIAVYGGALPEIVHDETALTPQSSYGTQKAMVELLLGDYSRKGFVDGRALRLPTITVRPGRPNAALSSFVSGIIREPLKGETAVCPVAREARVWVLSPSSVIECLIVGHDVPADTLGTRRVVNLPGLSVSVGEMVDALERVAGREVVQRIRWEYEDRVARVVATWPGAWDGQRALGLGFPGDESFDAIIRQHMAESGRP